MIRHGQKIKFRPIADCACGDHSFVTMTKGMVCLVSIEDRWVLEKCSWSTSATAHLRYAIRTGVGLLHRFLFQPSASEVIDHINFNGCDNRRSNVRVCTKKENNFNRRTARKKYARGVHPHNNRWVAQCAGKYVGIYGTEAEASSAYEAAAKQRYGEFFTKDPLYRRNRKHMMAQYGIEIVEVVR